MGLLKGFLAVPRGAGLLLRHGSLRKLALWPAVLSVVLLAGLVAASVHFGPVLIAKLWPGAGHWVGTLARLLAVVLLLAVSGGLFLVGSNLIAQPFIDPLSAEADRLLGWQDEAEALTVKGTLREAGALAADLAADIGLYLLAQVLLLTLWLVGAGPVQVGLSWLVNAWFTGAGMVCSPLCRRGLRGRARWAAMLRAPGLVLGVGLASLALMLVPLAQLLTLPVATLGGTLAVAEDPGAGVAAAEA